MCTDNNIGDEGAKGLGEVLKHNTVLTTLDLTSTFNDCVKQMDSSIAMFLQ